MSCHTNTRKHKDAGDSFVSICNNDLLYLVDHCYNVIGDDSNLVGFDPDDDVTTVDQDVINKLVPIPVRY